MSLPVRIRPSEPDSLRFPSSMDLMRAERAARELGQDARADLYRKIRMLRLEAEQRPAAG